MSAPANARGGPARAVVLALASVATAALAHRASGDALPAPFVLALLVLPVAAVAAALAGRRLPFAVTAALAGAGQLVLHQVFMVLAAGSCAAPVTGSPHSGHAASVAGSGACGMAEHPERSATLLHALATLAVVLLAARGSALVRQLLTAVRPRLIPVPVVLLVLRRPVFAVAIPRPAPMLVRGPLTLRGPPVLSV